MLDLEDLAQPFEMAEQAFQSAFSKLLKGWFGLPKSSFGEHKINKIMTASRLCL
jgi:hypothetical protein